MQVYPGSSGSLATMWIKKKSYALWVCQKWPFSSFTCNLVWIYGNEPLKISSTDRALLWDLLYYSIAGPATKEGDCPGNKISLSRLSQHKLFLVVYMLQICRLKTQITIKRFKTFCIFELLFENDKVNHEPENNQ